VQGLWYSGLLLALVSVTLAMQQSVLLHRLNSNDHGMHILRRSLGYWSGSQWEPRKLQILIWQMPVMLLNVSIALFDIGLLMQVYGAYIRGDGNLYVSSWGAGRLRDGHSLICGEQITVMFAVATAFAILCYLTSSLGIYTSISKEA